MVMDHGQSMKLAPLCRSVYTLYSDFVFNTNTHVFTMHRGRHVKLHRLRETCARIHATCEAVQTPARIFTWKVIADFVVGP